MRINARWTSDCGGKKDFDGPLVRVSTRYWPEDGGFYISDGHGFRKNDVLSKPSAKASIDLLEYGGEPEEPRDYVEPKWHTLIERQFEGESFEDVKAQVEAWAQTQMNRLENALRREFIFPAPSVETEENRK